MTDTETDKSNNFVTDKRLFIYGGFDETIRRIIQPASALPTNIPIFKPWRKEVAFLVLATTFVHFVRLQTSLTLIV